MYDCREDVRSMIEKLTTERDRIDRTISVLRALVDDVNHVELGRAKITNDSNGAAVEHANGHGNGHTNGITETQLSGNLARVVKTLRKLGEPLSATEIRRAIGPKPPAITTIHHLLDTAKRRGLAVRTGVKGSYKFAAQPLQ